METFRQVFLTSTATYSIVPSVDYTGYKQYSYGNYSVYFSDEKLSLDGNYGTWGALSVGSAYGQIPKSSITDMGVVYNVTRNEWGSITSYSQVGRLQVKTDYTFKSLGVGNISNPDVNADQYFNTISDNSSFNGYYQFGGLGVFRPINTGTVTSDWLMLVPESDFQPLTLSITPDFRMVEGNSSWTESEIGNTYIGTVTLSKAVPFDITINLITGFGVEGYATANEGEDYVLRDKQVTVKANQTSAQFSISLIRDDRVEPDDAFQIIANANVNGSLVSGSINALILNDDKPPQDDTNKSIYEAIVSANFAARDAFKYLESGDYTLFIDKLNKIAKAAGLFVEFSTVVDDYVKSLERVTNLPAKEQKFALWMAHRTFAAEAVSALAKIATTELGAKVAVTIAASLNPGAALPTAPVYAAAGSVAGGFVYDTTLKNYVMEATYRVFDVVSPPPPGAKIYKETAPVTGPNIFKGTSAGELYKIDSTKDRVIEKIGGGLDKIEAAVDYRLPEHVERLQLGTYTASPLMKSSGPTKGTGNNSGNDIWGNKAANQLYGLGGNDYLDGSAGNDKLVGGAGGDILKGGKGRDTFVFNSKVGKTLGWDTIIDFNVRDDTIALENAIFQGVGKAGKLSKTAFHVGQQAHDKSDRIIYDKDTGALLYDRDGTGPSEAVQFAQLSRGLKLGAADFIIT
jgi:Ca2+-binding RTX toxin-like protein